MPDIPARSPAEVAAQEALDQVFDCIRGQRDFRLEAGAGAGKTYSLVKALQWFIEQRGEQLVRQHQRVACITYTNVATDEITRRTDGHPAIHASTIHSFCWGLCKNFQSMLRQEVVNIEALNQKIIDAGGLAQQRIIYDLGYRRATETEVYLHHDDVLKLMVAMMEYSKFRRVFTARYPVLFIDEYQDTDSDFAETLVRNFVAKDEGPLVGLFGDSWQKIYRTGAGAIEHENLTLIGKEANFRSVPAVVDVLNSIRPALPQQVSDPGAEGSVSVFHSNSFAGERRAGGHWAGDLPAVSVHEHLESLRRHLEGEGWDPATTKILMLTHNVLAAEQNYGQLLDVFDFNDSLFRKEDSHIAFLVDVVEPACEAFAAGKYGEMFSIIGKKSARLASIEGKRAWSADMQRLFDLRQTGSIGDVIDLMKETARPRLPDAILRNEERLAAAEAADIEESRTLRQLDKLRGIPYEELIAVAQFINESTPFSTKHGVKGAEFENVLVVLGRGWNLYNWNQFLEWFPDGYPANKEESFYRNRNLFYVACSRPIKNLSLLFTQELSADALATLEGWFGAENIRAFEPS